MLTTPRRHSRIRPLRASLAVGAAGLLLAVLAPAAAAQVPVGAGAAASNTVVPLQAGPRLRIAAQATGPGVSTGGRLEIPNTDVLERSPKVGAGALGPFGRPPYPNPAPQQLTYVNPGFSGFDGLSHTDSRTASGGDQFSLEPPDQGLCVGRGFVLEAVNDVLAVYDTRGGMLAGPEALSAFLGYPPAIVRGDVAAYGPFVTDPKCLFDAATSRWFLTTLTLEVDPETGDFTGVTHVDIAVSQSSDPTGDWTLFHLYTTDDGSNGTPVHAGCPCLGDQPLIGADRNGFYISTNEFPVFANGFNGAQVYAISKRGLARAATGGSVPSVAMINAGVLATPDPEGVWYSIQPATSPAGTLGSLGNGTEYFLSALDFFTQSDNRIAVWALTNTRSLDDAWPNVTLSDVVIASEPYASTPTWGVSQRPGSTPLGSSLGEGLEQLNGNDDRMNQVVFANGVLYGAVNTLVGDGRRTGIAYFEVAPLSFAGRLAAHMAGQGYVSLANDSVLFPSIGVNGNGGAVMSFSISGPDLYPSTGYARLFAGPGGLRGAPSVAGPVHVAGAGSEPEDGFTGYVAYGGNGIARWGDYSAAVADASGNLWLAAEYIPGTPRTSLANWGTFISRVNPFGF